jgi:hypothetical protein
MNEDGTCPTCGQKVKAQEPITAKNIDLKKLAAGEDGDPDDMKAPWHFKLLMVLLTVYLVWRFYEMIFT